MSFKMLQTTQNVVRSIKLYRYMDGLPIFTIINLTFCPAFLKIFSLVSNGNGYGQTVGLLGIVWASISYAKLFDFKLTPFPTVLVNQPKYSAR